MISWLPRQRCGPIGVDIGSRSVKLLQFDAARDRGSRGGALGLAGGAGGQPRPSRRTRWWKPFATPAKAAISAAARPCCALGAGNLFVQNIRVAQATGDELTKIVHFEAAGRLPFAAEEADIRYLEADDVRQGDTVRREVVLLACYRPALDRMLSVAEQAGLRVAAIDPEPAAMLRCYRRQFRRDDDRQRRMMLVHVGSVEHRGGDCPRLRHDVHQVHRHRRAASSTRPWRST